MEEYGGGGKVGRGGNEAFITSILECIHRVSPKYYCFVVSSLTIWQDMLSFFSVDLQEQYVQRVECYLKNNLFILVLSIF